MRSRTWVNSPGTIGLPVWAGRVEPHESRLAVEGSEALQGEPARRLWARAERHSRSRGLRSGSSAAARISSSRDAIVSHCSTSDGVVASPTSPSRYARQTIGECQSLQLGPLTSTNHWPRSRTNRTHTPRLIRTMNLLPNSASRSSASASQNPAASSRSRRCSIGAGIPKSITVTCPAGATACHLS